MGVNFSKEIPNANLRVISLGAGVQSSVMALMAGMGKITPMPDCAIFADTQFEPKEIYEHLDWLTHVLPFPVHVVTAGNIKEDTLLNRNTSGGSYISMPLFSNESSIGRRQCTREYKLEPIRKKTRELLGLKKGERANEKVCETWIGISTDEMQRVKDSQYGYIKNRYPLLELGMKRRDCHKWFEQYFPHKKLKRSACIACPLNNNSSWRNMKLNDPDNFKIALDFDEKIRHLHRDKNSKYYVYQGRVPLKDADLSTAEDKGQLNFLDECEGMCGV